MPIRAYRSGDLDRLYAINQFSTPGVSSETRESLEKWIGLSTAFVAEDEHGIPKGFLTLVELGIDAYESANLRWFEARQTRDGGDTIYVDRIAIDPEARGQHIGEQLYHHAFDAFKHRREIGCEVNISPPNPGSQRFHERMGFRQIGERSYDHGRKSVGYWVRPLGAHPCR
ncbi:MAG: GNAT family N-acetyltransferase [Pseudomonadota bacterium]